ncbi:MAG: redoxin domain-containing protein [Blastocatellales bacterium]
MHAEELIPGNQIPLFDLPAANRQGHVGSWDYKQHQNLVLVFIHDDQCQACRELLREVAADYDEYQRLETEALIISRSEVETLRQFASGLNAPFPILSDRDGKVFDDYFDGAEMRAAGVFVVDRWGAIFKKAVADQKHSLPGESEIREWLEFIEIQCEECFPPEWPL